MAPVLSRTVGRSRMVKTEDITMRRRFASLAIAAAVLASACHGEQSTAAGPTGTTPPLTGLPIPSPTGERSGRIESLDTVADLLTYNQAANVGLSIPVEG